MADTDKSGKRDLMTTAVVVLLLTLVGAGAGFAVGSLLGESKMTAAEEAPPSNAAKAEVPADEASAKTKDGHDIQEDKDLETPHSDDVTLLPFPPVLTTLLEPKGKWIRLEGSIMIAASGEKPPELLAEEAGEQILTYLRSVRLSQLETASGILALRDDLDETVQVLSGGDVRGVLIHGLVVE